MDTLLELRLSKKQVKEVLEQLTQNLEEMENCLSDYAVGCFEVTRVTADKDTDFLYWIRVEEHEELDGRKYYLLQFLKEEQSR
jgi:hypothetical protein